MIEALKKMSTFYREMGLDMFKDGISVPGLTMRYMFMNQGTTNFKLFDSKDSDLHDLFKSNIVGGPSIIFSRYHSKRETYIREIEQLSKGIEPKLCEKILGFDANALYLFSIAQNQGTGQYLRRREETGFRKEIKHNVAEEWLEWISFNHNRSLQHKDNSKEKRIGIRQIPVDGYHSVTKTIYQFQGCMYDGHT